MPRKAGEEMATVTSTLKMIDAMTGPLKRVTQSMNLMISTMYDMQKAANTNINIDKTLSVAKQQLAIAESEIRQAINESTVAQQSFNKSVAQAPTQFNKLLSGVKAMAATYLSMQGAQAIARITDEYVNTQARLSLINDGLQTTAQLQDKIFAAANRSRGAYEAMADTVGKLGLLAGNAFKNNDELVAFTELMQKSFKVSGASAQEAEAAMYQLTQAMASGRLQGDEFRSIMENAPMLADAIAKYTKKSKAQLREMSREGTITSDIIKNAMFSAADDINKKFESMPRTFGDVANSIKNNALQAFGPVLAQIDQFLNSPAGINFVNGINQALSFTATLAGYLVTGLTNLFSLITTYWPYIAGALAAVAAYYLPTIITQLWSMVAPILTAAGAWALANWPILVMAIAIGAVIYVLNQLGVTADQVFGFIGGTMAMLVSYVYNVVAEIWNVIVSFAEFLANVFIDPVYAVKKLVYDLQMAFLQFALNANKGIEAFVNNFVSTFAKGINLVIKGINWLIDALNKIPGFNIGKVGEVSATSKVNLTSGIEAMINSLEPPKSDKNVVNFDKAKLAYIDGAKAFQKGYDWTSNAYKDVAGALKGIGKGVATTVAPAIPSAPKAPNIDKVGKVGKVGKIDDTVDISSEDLKALRDLAEMKSIQNFVTLTPVVRVTTGPISKDVDVDAVIKRIEQSLESEIAISAQGVYS